MRHSTSRLFLASTLALLLMGGNALLQAQSVTVPGYTASQPVAVRLSVSGRDKDGQFVGRTDDELLFVAGTAGQPIRVPVGRIDRVYFEIQPPRAELNDAVAAQNWGHAGALLLPVVRPLLPYLDLPQNNGVDLVENAADFLLKGTAFRLAAEDHPKLSEADVGRAKAAFTLFRALGTATWSELGPVGLTRSAEALLALGRREMADELIEKIAEPFPGEAAMGCYWLLRSRMAYADARYADALDSAARAVAFANKDIDMFPDALLTSARCYEHLESYYRARDVYYEVARLFPSTPAGGEALVHLRAIHDAGLTQKEEETPLVNIFFGVQENMNRRVSTLLNAVPIRNVQ
ncbi:MAG: hypothetical protein HQ523_10685 [Lentisphaerae bacterium]|nr:hypothetical protein [Lentisphaerota bacterium]